MDINAALRAFVRTVEKGSVTGAAKDLAISQPAVTKHLRNLERHVNARLLERSNRAVRPTPQGIALYEASRVALASIEAALEGVRRDMGEMRGALRIFAPSCIGAAHLDRIVMEFQDEHPLVCVDLVLDNRHVDLVYENFDLAIRYDRPENQDVIARRIGLIRRVLVASPAYLERVGPIDSAERLSELDVVTTLAVLSPRNTLTLCRGSETIEVPVCPKLRTNNAQVITRSLREARGIGPVQVILVSEDLATGKLVHILPDYSLRPAEMFLTYPSTRFMRPIVRAFVDFLVEKLRKVDGID
ncbi:LysR family transcriptional regulator [Mesorhizobium sp. RMAD-H1]|uniref:LysR family transcriptional regulator n=1 Tax=Mesorhizobium sp. RMAD-H1 TaxID=2587065 RepID=UPI00161C4175|nr:LysR family transcriptional regulator [Mesorhizobium sp. RMAD-H1]MBB2974182.1 DNA-binding transcriptional LysR family regulator [Mesorhizobium sp. RMAD-H1]